jgi:hypothetical protein
VSFQVRFDPETGVYRDCKWCGGKGCLACPEEAERAYKREFPDGPQPIMTITAEEFERADIDEALGTSNIEVTHGPLGRLAQQVWDQRKQ